MKQNTLNPGSLDFYIDGPLVHIDREKSMGHPQLSFQQDCRSFWQKEPVTLHHIVLPCLLVTDAFPGKLDVVVYWAWECPSLLVFDGMRDNIWTHSAEAP